MVPQGRFDFPGLLKPETQPRILSFPPKCPCRKKSGWPPSEPASPTPTRF